jgi:short-subunit dehydrogenase
MSKVAIVTGGSSGLGLEIGKNLYDMGFTILLLARNKEKLLNACQGISKDSKRVRGYSCDITDEEGLRSVYKDVYKEFGSIDFLVLNAGVVSVNLLCDYKNTLDLKKDIENNLWGTVLSSYIFLPLLKENSKVLFISSGFGLMGPAGYSTYAASKAGIINFAESLRRELLHKKINVYVSVPGDMDTPQFHEEHASMPKWMKKNAPRGMMHPRTAASKILKKCNGSRFMIIINGEISSLIIMTKLFPRRIRDFLLDIMFPKPTK